jgi:uncharacterized membrane protein YbhN (UPF0104 family)
MNKKRFLITALVLVVLAALVYLQVRTWKKFDWHRFWMATHNTNKFYLVAGVALVYADYFLRAVRWKIMLRPVCPEAKSADLLCRAGPAGKAGRVHPPLPDRAQNEFKHGIATGSVDGGTNL